MKVYKLASYFCAKCHAELYPFTKDGDTTNIYLEHPKARESDCSQMMDTARLRLVVHDLEEDLKIVS